MFNNNLPFLTGILSADFRRSLSLYQEIDNALRGFLSGKGKFCGFNPQVPSASVIVLVLSFKCFRTNFDMNAMTINFFTKFPFAREITHFIRNELLYFIFIPNSLPCLSYCTSLLSLFCSYTCSPCHPSILPWPSSSIKGR